LLRTKEADKRHTGTDVGRELKHQIGGDRCLAVTGMKSSVGDYADVVMDER
jgi:hypothetical protein